MASYKIKSGDTVSQIAKRMGVRVQDIVSANPNLKDVNKISVGQSLKIPAAKTGKNKGSQGPYGRVSQTEMNMMRGKGDEYTRGVRAKMKAGAETSATPKEKAKLGNRLVGSSLSPAATAKAKAKRDAMPLPKSKPKKKPTPVSSKTGSSLSATAMAKAKALKNAPAKKPTAKATKTGSSLSATAMAKAKALKAKAVEKQVKTAAKQSRRKGRKDRA
jgi:murein DD-endopeptidase MepM/ murein hydrolase activator NlpD